MIQLRSITLAVAIFAVLSSQGFAQDLNLGSLFILIIFNPFFKTVFYSWYTYILFCYEQTKKYIHIFFTEGKCTKGSTLDKKNRDQKKPEFPLQVDLRIKSSFIYKAHEILRNGLVEFLRSKNHMDLGFYLRIMTQNNATYFDEHENIISSYSDVWRSIWKQYNETLCENYATKQFENDKLDLCSVARYLSHQLQLKYHHTTILERMRVALKINKCDTCLPYNRNDPGETIVCPSSALGYLT